MSIELVADLPGHAGPAWCVAWNPMRPLLASCSSDKTVRLYAYDFKQGPSAQDFSLSFRFLSEIPTAHKRTIRSIAWSPNGRSLATGSFDSTVGIWEEVDEFEGIEGVVRDGETSLEREWECVTTLEGHESECKSVGWSADGQLLASCSRDKSVWIWERQSTNFVSAGERTVLIQFPFQFRPTVISSVYL
jgi:WD40 repeat protein